MISLAASSCFSLLGSLKPMQEVGGFLLEFIEKTAAWLHFPPLNGPSSLRLGIELCCKLWQESNMMILFQTATFSLTGSLSPSSMAQSLSLRRGGVWGREKD